MLSSFIAGVNDSTMQEHSPDLLSFHYLIWSLIYRLSQYRILLLQHFIILPVDCFRDTCSSIFAVLTAIHFSGVLLHFLFKNKSSSSFIFWNHWNNALCTATVPYLIHYRRIWDSSSVFLWQQLIFLRSTIKKCKKSPATSD